MKSLFLFPCLFLLFSTGFSQTTKLDVIPKASFKLKKGLFEAYQQEEFAVLDSRPITSKCSFRVHPKKGIITYKGDSLLPKYKNTNVYTIVNVYEDEKTITYVTKSDDFGYETLVVFWKDHFMVMIHHPDEAYAIAHEE